MNVQEIYFDYDLTRCLRMFFKKEDKTLRGHMLQSVQQ